jgi:hypothetical protein
MTDKKGYPTPSSTTRVTGVARTRNPNSGIQTPVPPEATKIQYPTPTPKTAVQQKVQVPGYPKPPQTTTVVQPRTKATQVNQKTKVAIAPKFQFQLPTLPKFDVKQNIIPLVGTGIALAAVFPILLNIFPYPRVIFQKALNIPSQECKSDDGKYLAGNVMILGQDGKTNVLYSCRDSILNGVESGVKRGVGEDGKTFSLPAGNYVINKAKKFYPGDENNKPLKDVFAYEYAVQEKGKTEINNDLGKLPDNWTSTHQVGSVGMIYPINYNSTDLIKGNEIALELGVKPDSTVYQLHKLGYLDGTTLVVRGNLKP